MGITTDLLPGPKEQFNGAFEQETWELTGDGSSTSVAVRSQALKQIDAAWGTPAISFEISGNAVKLTFAPPLAKGAKVYLVLRGNTR